MRSFQVSFSEWTKRIVVPHAPAIHRAIVAGAGTSAIVHVHGSRHKTTETLLGMPSPDDKIYVLVVGPPGILNSNTVAS
jgi:hypothetical protein